MAAERGTVGRARRLVAGIALAMTALLGAAQTMTAEQADMLSDAAERGSSAAQLLLGLAYLRGDRGLTPDPATAARWLENAALQGNAQAERELGELYARGEGVAKNPRLAADWWEKAALRGDRQAQCRLGERLLAAKAAGGDPEQGRYWLERAAAEGSAEAQYRLGRMYQEGEWVTPDDAKANALLHRSDLPDDNHAVDIAQVIAGIGYAMDEWYHQRQPELRKLADDGDPEAQYQLGMRLERGEFGSVKDVPAAIDWYRRAAASGHLPAMTSLAHLYAHGAMGLRADPALAREWAAMAAVAGR
ncbi:MAG: tetratricopeptide repeat protein [Rhodocyclaceae bacterium]|nr:tetratricopeptide repeat protein [Rhodocyclaceae bacterium]